MPAALNRTSAKRVQALKALAHPSRLKITEALAHREMCVSEIRNLVGDDISTVSKHLSILRNAGVLISEKRGLSVYYALACSCFQEFLDCIDQVCPSQTKNRAKRCC